MRLTRLGELSRALGRLTSLGVAPPSTATAQTLRDELVGRAPHPGPPAGIGIAWRENRYNQIHIDTEALRRRLQSVSKGSSPSLSGWRFELLQLSLRTQQAFTALHTVTNLIANATAPPALIEGLRLNPLTAKKRSDGRARPLAAPETLRRLVAGTLCAAYKPAFVDALAHRDHAIGVPAGT